MPSLRLGVAGLAAAALVLAACSPTPSPSSAPATQPPAASPSLAPPASAPVSPAPSQGAGDDAAVYAAIRADIEAIRGLQPTAEVEPVVIDEEQLRENLEAELDAEQTPEEVKLSEDLLKTLGLIPQDASLLDITLDLLAGQVIGYYSPERDELFVVTKTGQTVGGLEKATYAHEFVHQLQDQTFDLSKVNPGEIDQSDRVLAASGLIEGDAVSAQFTWIPQHMTPEELVELLEAANDPEAMEALNNAPAYLRETSIFPYDFVGGLGFVQALIASGGYDAVDAAFADPPASTEQVLHPEKYLQREDPVEVRIPEDIAKRVGNGWSEEVRDTLGELILRIWLTENGVRRPAAERAVAGWGGDRLVMFRSPNGSLSVGMKTTWDTAADAAEFAEAATTAARNLDGSVVYRQGSRDVLIALGASPAAVLEALG